MADYASIMGGNAPDSMIGQSVELDEVGADWNARYFIESANIFLDRFDTVGDSIVDATTNPSGVRVELGSGVDTIMTGAGDDRIWTGAGADLVDVRNGDNTVSGGAGDDQINSGSGNDSLSGGTGNDTLIAGAGRDYLAGGDGEDRLGGGDGNDSLFGGAGADFMDGNDGDDSLVGGGGADMLVGGAGNDTLVGGIGGGDVFAFESGFGQDVITDFRPGDRIHLAADLNGSGIADASDVVGLVSGGTTASGTKFTVITIGDDSIRLEKVDATDFINQINSWVQVG